MAVSSERLRRFDGLPEGTDYVDEGCSYFPRCLACPLPKCRYDSATGVKGILNVARDQDIRALYETGIDAEHVARQFGITKRTVFRVLAATAKVAAA